MAARRPLLLDGDSAALLGLGSVTLPELRVLVLDPATSGAIKDDIWRVLLGQVQLSWSAWATACTWLALPGLGRTARQIRRQLASVHSGSQVHAEDVESELVAGFLQALCAMTPSAANRPRVFARLLKAAGRHARRLLDDDDARVGLHPTADLSEAVESGGLAGWSALGQVSPVAAHPEAVLARAVRAGVIRAEDGDLIARTRLEPHSLGAEAASTGESRAAISARRRRAELAVAAAVRADRL